MLQKDLKDLEEQELMMQQRKGYNNPFMDKCNDRNNDWCSFDEPDLDLGPSERFVMVPADMFELPADYYDFTNEFSEN